MSLFKIFVQGNGLLLQLAQVLQVDQVFFKLLPGELLKNSLFDKEAILQPSLPAIELDPLGDGIIHFYGQNGLFVFHGTIMMAQRVNNVNI